jgi:hypothetical protein
MRMRVLRRKLTVMAVCAMSVGAILVTAAAPASAATTGEFGVRFKDNNQNGQCRVETDQAGDVTTWAPVDSWTRYLAIDTDSRAGGCQLWFGLNNPDGSLNGLQLSYTYTVNPGGSSRRCAFQTPSPQPIKFFPLPIDWPIWIPDPGITLDSDAFTPGWCNLTMYLDGTSNIVLDIRYWYVQGTDGGQCISAAQPGTEQVWTVRKDHPVTIGLNSGDSAGACYLAFRLRRT